MSISLTRLLLCSMVASWLGVTAVAQNPSVVRVHSLADCLPPARDASAADDPWRAIALDHAIELLRHGVPGVAIPADCLRAIGSTHLAALATPAQHEWLQQTLTRNARNSLAMEFAVTAWELPEADYQQHVHKVVSRGERRHWQLPDTPSEHYVSSTGQRGMHVNETAPHPAGGGYSHALSADDQSRLRRALAGCDAARECLRFVQIVDPFEAASHHQGGRFAYLRDYVRVVDRDEVRHEPIGDVVQIGEGASIKGFAREDSQVQLHLRCWSVTADDPVKVRFLPDDDGEAFEYQIPRLQKTMIETGVAVAAGQTALLECATGRGTRLVVMVRARTQPRGHQRK